MNDHSPAVRVTLRPIATPIVMTFAGLALASLVVSGQELGWFGPAPDKPLIGWLLLAGAVPLQFLAAAWAYLTRSAPAATSAAVLGATWLATGLTLITTLPTPGLPPELAVLYLMSAALLTTCAVVDGVISAILPAAVIGLSALRFVVSGVFGLTDASWWQDTSGIVGLVVAGAALYAVLALQLENALQREVLPVGRRRAGAAATGGGWAEQVEGIVNEPGVRQTL